MTVTTHIAEILRQGIWASLTGGWYYEPAHTIFCNTVHLYLWLLLLIVPLVIGLATAGAFSLPIIIAYTAFVGLMFIALKVIVSYLHIVFDTTEPVITTKGNENSEVTTIGDINEDGMQLQEIRSGTNSRPVLDIRANATDSDDGGIEMREIRRTDRTEGRPARSRLMDAANARQAARRRVRIEFEPRDENIGPVDVADVEMEFRTRGTFMGKLVPSEQRTAVLEKIIAMEMKAQNLREEAYSSRSRREEATSSSHVPFSLLEIDEDEAALAGPEVEVEEVRDDAVTTAGPRSSTPVSKSGIKSKASHGASGMRRKLSEPALTADGFPWNEGRRCSDGVMGDAARVRRANSTFEPRRNHREKGMLSQSSLTQARQNTNKSYPSKMSSDDEFKRLVKEGRLAVSSTSDNHVVSDASEADCDADVETDAEMAQYNMQPWKDVGTTRVFGPVGDYDDEPCCSTSSARVVTRPGTPIEPLIGPAPRLSRDFDPEHISERAMSSSSAWIPVVVSLSDSDRPSTSTSTALARISDEKQAMIDGITDIKGEITKFLEDLIDKHPETLDAIESVRQSRLGRTLVMPRGVTTSIRNSSVRRGSGSSAVFSDLTIKDGTHVASGHEDTTQGALHSFQDEDGNWWTYSFDEHGVGTAQPLGSGTALMEIIQRERSHDSVTGKRVLDALPESEFGSTDDEDEVTEAAAAIQLPSTSRQPSGGAGSSGGTSGGTSSGRVVTTTRRERALSSSSNESYTYIPSVPTAVMHAGTGTTATRSSRNMVSFVNVASRLRSSLRQSSEERLRQGELDQIIELLDRGRAVSNVGAGGGGGGSVGTGADRHRGSGSSASALHLRMMQMQERMFRLDSVDSTSSSTRRILHEMGLMGGDQPFTPTAADFMSPPRRPTVKRRYYYQMKMFPKTDKSFKLKLDRLAVAALFDRNRSLLSCCFDIFLACLVSLLAGLVLSTGIFYDVSLFFFAFCVAGAHFSLLKSVQPDAASPIHGFNWLVAYSRPIYFCLLCSVMLGLHYLADDPQNEKIPWNWNPYRLGDVNSSMILIAARDLVGTFLVLLPLCFTLGWLPQVNTLAHHVLEQTEMHLFGGTASLGVFSAVIQLTKSAAAWAALAIVCHFARVSSPSTTQSPAFSGFVALSVGLSYLLSRFSSNPQLTAVLLRSMWQSVRSAIPSRLFPATAAETVDEAVGDKDTVDSLIDPLPGSLRTTISLRARHDVFFATVISLAVFALHSTSVFTATRPYFMLVIVPLCVCVSTFNHYLYLQLRAHTPWKLIANPILRSGEFSQFECVKEARLMAFERFHVWSQAIERNVLYPLLIVCQLCDSAWHLPLSVFLSPLIAIRLLRGSFSHPQLMYVPLTMSYLVTRFDWAQHMPFGLETVRAALDPIVARSHYVDIDHMFCSTNDEDYDAAEAGISRQSFSEWYMDWIRHCIRKRAEANPDEVINRDHVSCLCYMLSLLGRRALGTASHNRHSTAAESFLYGLHALFKGDFRIQCHRDEWVFADMDLLRCVISPAVKMALKLHQDHFASTDDFDDEESLYNLISEHQTKLFISHEQDPAWRRAILANTSSLLALRHMYDDGQDDYKIIMLNKMHLNMRVIKLNRECVRAFWAGQQQELIFLRNRNPERGSIQNARQVLRNMINSSADQPVGYPIYVSPLTTSYVDTHSQIAKVIGPPITIEGIGNGIISAWKGLRWYLGTSTSSSRRHGGCPPTNAASGSAAGGAGAASSSPKDSDVDRTSQQSGSSQAENSIVHMSADGTARVSLAKRSTGDTPTHQANQKKTSGSVGGGSATSAGSATGDTLPTTSGAVKRVSHERSVSSTTAADASAAGCSEEKEGGGVGGMMMGDEGSVVDGSDSGRDPYDSIPNENGDLLWLEVTDTEQIFKYLSEPLKSTGQPLVHWPDEEMRQFASAKNWMCTPLVGMIGRVIYIWYPNHPNKKKRNHIGDIIYLICVPMMANSLFVVGEKGARVRTEKEIKADMIRQNEEQEKENAKITAERDRLRELKRSEETTKTEEDGPEKSE